MLVIVFYAVDVIDECFAVPFLRYIRYEESNDKSQLIFGSPTIVTARDAIPLTVRCLRV